MVPVWIFEGTWTVDEHWQNSNVPVMVLNALDGSVVEENPGYRSY